MPRPPQTAGRRREPCTKQVAPQKNTGTQPAGDEVVSSSTQSYCSSDWWPRFPPRREPVANGRGGNYGEALTDSPSAISVVTDGIQSDLSKCADGRRGDIHLRGGPPGEGWRRQSTRRTITGYLKRVAWWTGLIMEQGDIFQDTSSISLPIKGGFITGFKVSLSKGEARGGLWGEICGKERVCFMIAQSGKCLWIYKKGRRKNPSCS